MDYFSDNRRLRLDYAFGARGAGLVLYGALPSALAALEAVRVPGFVAKSPQAAVPLIVVAIVPLVVLFLLVRQRLDSWYVFRRRLNLRAAVILGQIVVVSTVVSFAAGYLTGRYREHGGGEGPEAWIEPLLHSLVLAIVVLIAASTLFLAAVKSESALPGLPTPEFGENVRELRRRLRTVAGDGIWKTEEGIQFAALTATIDHSLRAARNLRTLSRAGSARRALFQALIEDLANLQVVLTEIQAMPTMWNDLVGREGRPRPETLGDDRAACWRSCQRLRSLAVDGS